MRSESGSGRNLHDREDGLLGGVLSEGPVGDVNAARAGVVELDEGVRRIAGRSGTDAELVDLDRAGVAKLLGRRLGLRFAVGLIGPCGFGDEVAVKGGRAGGDLEDGADARTGRNGIGEGLY